MSKGSYSEVANMSEHIWHIGKVQIIFSSGSKVLSRVLIALIAVSAAAIGALSWVSSSVTEQTEAVRRQAAALEYANAVLQEKIDSMDTVHGMLEIAKEELDMVSPDTILFQMQ